VTEKADHCWRFSQVAQRSQEFKKTTIWITTEILNMFFIKVRLSITFSEWVLYQIYTKFLRKPKLMSAFQRIILVIPHQIEKASILDHLSAENIDHSLPELIYCCRLGDGTFALQVIT
jgi:hypothetical protein